MLKFKIPDKQYVLSLDSLDLNFLSQYVEKPSDEKRLLWSKSVEEDSALYQVEIVSEEEVDQDENAFIEPYESYTCHICNIDVPKEYYEQHNKSARHQNYKKLVEKILENARKQMNTDIDSVPNNQEYDMFYCETCCKVITQNNIQNHKKSNYHIQSIENEQLTSKFIDIYLNKNNNDNFQSEINYKNLEFRSNSDSDLCDDTNANSNSKNYSNNNVPYEGNDCIEIEEIENFKIYLKEMVVKYKLDVKLPSVAGDSIVIVTPAGHKEHITTDAFHSYQKMYDTVFCLSCLKLVHKNLKEHSVSEEHVRNIFQPINDNFAREVINDNQYSHCLICNERFLTTSNHVGVNPKHKKYLHQSSLNSKICDSNPESFLEMKSNSIPYEEPNASYLSKNTIDSSLPKMDLEEKLMVYRKQFSIVNATTLKCLVCPNFNVHYDSNNVIEHVESGCHSKACDDLLRKNYLVQVTLSEYYCNFCNIFTDDFPNHIKFHDKSKEYSSISNKENISASNLSTNSIDSSLPNTYLGTVKEKVNKYLKQFTIVKANLLKCLVCSSWYVPYIDCNIIAHVEGRFHSEACANFLLRNCLTQKSLSEYYCNLCQKSTDDFVDHIKSHVKRKPKKIDDDKRKLIKYVYNDPLNVSPAAIQWRKKYQDCLRENQVVPIINKRFYCKICSSTISLINEIDHIFGERHRRHKLAISSTWNAS